MSARGPVLLCHPGDPIGEALAQELRAGGPGVREVRPEPQAGGWPDLVEPALGCRAIVAVCHGCGDAGGGPELRDLLAAAQMPGVSTLVLVDGGDRDLSALRRSGVPYTVLRPAPLAEALLVALEPALAAGRLTLLRDSDPSLSWVAARDVARAAIAAVDSEEACGRTLAVAAPGPAPLSELAQRAAVAGGRRLKLSRLPRWAAAALRPFGRVPFALPVELVQQVDGSEATALLLGGRAAELAEVVAAAQTGTATLSPHRPRRIGVVR